MKKKSKRFDPMGKDYDEETPAAHGAKSLARTRIEVAAHQLRPAPWNPRPEITSESVADITASIREIGLIQPLVVIKDPGKQSFGGVDFYLIVAGHRRFKACVDAKLSPIPCDVINCDEAAAKRVTIIENLQRKDVDPLMEADLIAGLLEGGMTQAEIAAETGRGERWVARRANLRKLSPSWRKRVADGEQITIDCLEHVAAYPEEIQEKCKDARGGYYGSLDTGLTWSGIKWEFTRESRDLRNALFDATGCTQCPNNTGCCPDLFDDDGEMLGKCLDAKCFAAKIDEVVNATVAQAEARGRTIVRNRQPEQCGVYVTTKRPTKTNTALYVYTDANGRKTFEFAAPPPEKDTEAEKAAKAKKREDRKRDELIKKARAEADDKFGEWIAKRHKDGHWPKWFIDHAVGMLLEFQGSDEVDLWAERTNFVASDAEADKVYREFLEETV